MTSIEFGLGLLAVLGWGSALLILLVSGIASAKREEDHNTNLIWFGQCEDAYRADCDRLQAELADCQAALASTRKEVEYYHENAMNSALYTGGLMKTLGFYADPESWASGFQGGEYQFAPALSDYGRSARGALNYDAKAPETADEEGFRG